MKFPPHEKGLASWTKLTVFYFVIDFKPIIIRTVTETLYPQNTPMIMGVLNITPDSFSDGGRFFTSDAALAHALQMVDDGADIIDVGGESTRPGSAGVSAEEELHRVVPIIEAIHRRVPVKISVDTTRLVVAEEALKAGASMVNDVSMLRRDAKLAVVAAQYDATLILSHSRKTPLGMQQDIMYSNLLAEVREELLEAVSLALEYGVSQNRLWLDPGIGFAKTADHNIEIMSRLSEIVDCGFPVLVGPSRKSFIAAYSGDATSDRLGGTAAAVAICIYNGASAVRVHDVAIMKQVAVISAALKEASGEWARNG